MQQLKGCSIMFCKNETINFTNTFVDRKTSVLGEFEIFSFFKKLTYFLFH